jgi:hypothetical protein
MQSELAFRDQDRMMSRQAPILTFDSRSYVTFWSQAIKFLFQFFIFNFSFQFFFSIFICDLYRQTFVCVWQLIVGTFYRVPTQSLVIAISDVCFCESKTEILAWRMIILRSGFVFYLSTPNIELPLNKLPLNKL